MATDATGPVTVPDNIPTYNTAADAPSGKGLNAIVAALQAALSALRPSSIIGYPADATKFLRGDGTWAAQAAQRRIVTGTVTGATATITSGTGFTVVRNSAGVYTITFTTGWTAPPTLLVTTSNGAPAGYNAVGTASAQILTFNAGFTAADANFMFAAVETA